MTQNQRGVIYVGNQNGVLIYDGVSWQIIRIPNNQVRSMSIHENGTIYIGGKNEFGYLAPNSIGELEYVSLVEFVDKKYKPFSVVYSTAATKDGVYFRTAKFLFRWNFESIDWVEPGKFRSLFLTNGVLLTRKLKAGLMKVENNSIVPVANGESVLKRKLRKIWMMAPYGHGDESGSFLLGTDTEGLFLFSGNRLEPFVTEADEYLKANKISHGIRTSGGAYAVATQLGGLVILDYEGNIKYIFNKNSGLADNGVTYVFEDKSGNIWLALSNGLARLEYQSPFFHYDNSNGLDGISVTVTRHLDDLYVGTTRGLFVLRSGTDSFSPIARSGFYLDLLPTDHGLLAATAEGVFFVAASSGPPQKLSKIRAYKLFRSEKFTGNSWCASDEGLLVLSLIGTDWNVGPGFEEMRESIRDLVELPSGTLWLYTASGGLIKVDFPESITRPLIKRYSLPPPLEKIGIYALAVVQGGVVLASDKGLFRFDAGADGFIPQQMPGLPLAGGPDARSIFRIAEDKNNRLWFHSKGRNGMVIPGATEPPTPYVMEACPFGRIPLEQANDIFPDPDSKNIWFAVANGVIRHDASLKPQYHKEFPALIRKVICNESTIIYGGYESAGGQPREAPVLLYKDRHISFHTAAPFFEREKDTLYRYRLDGFNNSWSKWSGDSKKHYTNLDNDNYTFRVQAKNVYGVISREGNFSFTIPPPWYKTWWAYALYVSAFLLLFYLAVKWRSHKLVLEKKRLEGIVEDRTREIRHKNEQLEHKTLLLKEQAEKLEELDKIKARFFANISHEFRTPLTLIMSPLQRMLSRCREIALKKDYHVMLRNSQKLLFFINQLLDLARLDSGKIKLLAVHRDVIPFLKGEIASFRPLAEQNDLTLELVCETESIFLYFDLEKMEEVIYNLLSNAVKFTPAGGGITVSVAVESQPSTTSVCRIVVKDTGLGIPESQQDKIFDRFFQVGNQKDLGGKGTGIGLALAKEMVTLHGGTIDVYSPDEKGSQFIVRLPLGKSHLTENDILREQVSKKKTSKIKDFILADTEPVEDTETTPDQSETAGRQDKDETAAPAPEKNIVLVVEDNGDMRRHIRGILEPGYDVIEAVDGLEGIAKAKECIPDLIISDIMMPGVDGYALCGKLKKDLNCCHIPIILLTAKASHDSVLRGLDTGADDYISKPFNSESLLARIDNLIQLRRQLQLKIQRDKKLLPSEVPVSSMDDQFLNSFQEIIETHLDDPDFNIEVLCEKLLVGRATLFRKIPALTGEKPNQFIQSYRLKRAAQLLKDNYGNVTEVAMAVGFSSSQYFSTLFKEKFHQSPKAFQTGAR
ncbi:MAG: response regulator [bacterium]|nr:response regulator [bacterium]